MDDCDDDLGYMGEPLQVLMLRNEDKVMNKRDSRGGRIVRTVRSGGKMVTPPDASDDCEKRGIKVVGRA
jgi:hypothetical protein